MHVRLNAQQMRDLSVLVQETGLDIQEIFDTIWCVGLIYVRDRMEDVHGEDRRSTDKIINNHCGFKEKFTQRTEEAG